MKFQYIKHYFFFLTVCLMSFSQVGYGQVISIVKPQKDSLFFGDATMVSYAMNKIPQECKSVVIDLSKIKNMVYESDSSMFEPYADVIVDFGSTDLQAYFNEKEKILTIPVSYFENDNNQAVSIALKFLSFGVFAIPPALFQDEKGIIEAQYTPAKISVKLQNAILVDSTLTVNDIKPIAEIKPSIWSWLKYVILAFGILALAYFVYIKYFKAKVVLPIETQEVIEVIAPEVEAMDRLTKLKKEQSWKWGKEKEFQSELTFTIRNYIQKKYGFGALEMTSDEVISEMRSRNISSRTWISLIDDVLHIADLVKFAKAKPDDNIHEDFVDKAIDFVEATKRRD